MHKWPGAQVPERARLVCRGACGGPCAASLIACLLLERPEIGRRRSVFLFYALGGACCMGTRFARGAGATALYMLGKLALTAAFDSIYQYSRCARRPYKHSDDSGYLPALDGA